MYKLRYLPQAVDDLKSIKQYLDQESGFDNVGREFVGDVRIRCKWLASVKGRIGQPRPDLRENLRSFPHGNYVIFFVYEKEFLTIAAVVEGHRDVKSLFEN